MRRFLTAACCIASLFSVGSRAFADGLFRSLPDAGAWATFRMAETWSDGTKRKIDVTLKALEKREIDGVDCRWVEIVFETPDKSARKAFRFLTPRHFLRTGEDPLGQAKDVWVRNLNNDPQRDLKWDEFLPRLMLACPPKIDETFQQTETVDLEEGAGKGHVVTGRGTQKFYGGALTVSTKYRLITAKAVPFGTARATLKVTERAKCDLDNPDAVCDVTTGTVKFTLTDSGRNAESLIQIGNTMITDELLHPLEPATEPNANGTSTPPVE